MTLAMNGTCRSGQHVIAEVGQDSRGGCKACSTEARYGREESRVERMRRLMAEARTPRPGWQADAECGGKDVTVFLPVDARGQSADQVANRNLVRHLEAKRSCAVCSVRLDCLGYAVLGELPPHGTWGGEFFSEPDWVAKKQVLKQAKETK